LSFGKSSVDSVEIENGFDPELSELSVPSRWGMDSASSRESFAVTTSEVPSKEGGGFRFSLPWALQLIATCALAATAIAFGGATAVLVVGALFCSLLGIFLGCQARSAFAVGAGAMIGGVLGSKLSLPFTLLDDARKVADLADERDFALFVGLLVGALCWGLVWGDWPERLPPAKPQQLLLLGLGSLLLGLLLGMTVLAVVQDFHPILQEPEQTAANCVGIGILIGGLAALCLFLSAVRAWRKQNRPVPTPVPRTEPQA